MPVSLLTPRSMTDMVNKIVPTVQFILDLIFKNHKQHFTDTVDIPIKSGKRKLSKPSRKGSAAGVVVKDGAEIKTLRVPHIREKMLSTAATALENASQGGIYIGQSQKKALEMDVADNQLMLKDRARVAMEFMACQALFGAVTMTGKDISFTVDYGFDSSHLPTKTGTAKWDGAEADIIGDLRNWKRVIMKDYGVAPTVCILGTDAAAAFIKDEAVMKALNNLNYKAGVLNLEAPGNYLGRILNMDIYEYQNTYLDDSDASQEMFPTSAAVLVAPNSDFVLNFAAVVDVKAGLMPVEFFSKTWEEEDPSGVWVLAETNPLPSVNNPNAVLAATVV